MAYLKIPFSGSFWSSVTSQPLAGAAVTITIRDSAGVAVVTGAACTEYISEGESYYFYGYTPTTDDTFSGVMSTAHADAIQSWMLVGSEASFDPASAGATAAQVWSYATRTLTSPTLVFDAPFYPDGTTLTLVRGDSYSSGLDNRPLQWSSSDYPVLTGGSIALLMRSANAPNDVLSFAGTVVNATTAQVVLTSTQTGAFDVSSNVNAPAYRYALVATLSDATVVTLALGNIIVKRTATNL